MVCLVTAPSTHSVCLCCIHHNVTMMNNNEKFTHTYKDLLSMMVCDMDSEVCMLYGCLLCSTSDNAADCGNKLPQDDGLFEISYKQWVTTDQSNLVTAVKPYADFNENILQKLHILRNTIMWHQLKQFFEGQDGTVKYWRMYNSTLVSF